MYGSAVFCTVGDGLAISERFWTFVIGQYCLIIMDWLANCTIETCLYLCVFLDNAVTLLAWQKVRYFYNFKKNYCTIDPQNVIFYLKL